MQKHYLLLNPVVVNLAHLICGEVHTHIHTLNAFIFSAADPA